MRRGCALAVLAVAIGCKDGADEPAAAPRAPADVPMASSTAGPTSDAAALAPSVPRAEPRWVTRVPHEPGVPVLEGTAGPAVGGGVAVVGSSVFGFAAVSLAGGEVVWLLGGERRPEAVDIDGDAARLRGSCMHMLDEMPAARGRVYGCELEVALADGAIRARRWLTAQSPPPVPRLQVTAERLRGPGWVAKGRFATPLIPEVVPGAALVVRLSDGLGPVHVDGDSGVIVAEGERVSAIDALAVATGAGHVAVAARFDASLLRDAVLLFDDELSPVRLWPLPALHGPRVDPVGLAAAGVEGFVVFYDGRYVAYLPVSETATP